MTQEPLTQTAPPLSLYPPCSAQPSPQTSIHSWETRNRAQPTHANNTALIHLSSLFSIATSANQHSFVGDKKSHTVPSCKQHLPYPFIPLFSIATLRKPTFSRGRQEIAHSPPSRKQRRPYPFIPLFSIATLGKPTFSRGRQEIAHSPLMQTTPPLHHNPNAIENADFSERKTSINPKQAQGRKVPLTAYSAAVCPPHCKPVFGVRGGVGTSLPCAWIIAGR